MQTNYGQSQLGQAVAPSEPTLNERLSRASGSLGDACDRIEKVLSRINGTPGNPSGISAGDKVARIDPIHALANVAEQMEQHQSRLHDLAHALERVA